MTTAPAPTPRGRVPGRAAASGKSPGALARRTRLVRLAAGACSLAGVLAGCATVAGPTLDAQWRSPALQLGALRGARVLVRCESTQPTIGKLCEDRIAAALGARGALPVRPLHDAVAPPRPGAADVRYLPEARALGADAVLGVTIGLSSRRAEPAFSIGIGGFGVGRHVGGGIGVSAPIGGGAVEWGYSASARVTDARSERLLWTALASTPPSPDAAAQMADLARVVVDAAARAGLF